MIFDQSEFDLRCEWGKQGIAQLAPISDVIIIVDVLSFSTSVEIATNQGAIARFAQTYGSKIAVIPAGERWEDESLRPAWEDWIGAGAILSYLEGSCSPEAGAAIATFRSARNRLQATLKQCSSGKELIARGFAADVELAGTLNASDCVSLLVNGAYIKQLN